MTTPLTILLADDQVPWDTDAENERAKAEIRREFAIAKPHVDVDTAFADDHAWFAGLLNYLEQTKCLNLNLLSCIILTMIVHGSS